MAKGPDDINGKMRRLIMPVAAIFAFMAWGHKDEPHDTQQIQNKDNVATAASKTDLDRQP